MDIQVLYEDESIVVVDKPSGVVVNRAETVVGETLQDWMVERYQERFEVGEVLNENEQYFVERAGMVHRLDKETSGVMVFAKNANAFTWLLTQFRERKVVKEYLALTHGIWQAKTGEIDMPIGRRRDDRKKMGVREDGRESVTEYEVINEVKTYEFLKELKVDVSGYQGFSWVRFIPKTGRTHQIRVHARAVGHPLVGDVQYAGRKRSREDRKWFPRVALQAQKISFIHPVTGVWVSFESRCKFAV